jgi:hypothetical protein
MPGLFHGVPASVPPLELLLDDDEEDEDDDELLELPPPLDDEDEDEDEDDEAPPLELLAAPELDEPPLPFPGEDGGGSVADDVVSVPPNRSLCAAPLHATSPAKSDENMRARDFMADELCLPRLGCPTSEAHRLSLRRIDRTDCDQADRARCRRRCVASLSGASVTC